MGWSNPSLSICDRIASTRNGEVPHAMTIGLVLLKCMSKDL